ncbi:hypothetical protein N9V47_03715 [Luminiphilus sp.]|jgi:hypothetical protein|nr:hypothetical protein [Luminiphilus sp.]MDA8738985.1 hypothetical protein [Luminiphilus sp.]MDB2312747.1 hypothetical protein [Luminiphilus sp.]MDB2380138.1 hypothetical protein [Luminiphilus sp.]MDB2440262.1 hypothetical protein [Luminiphilus sp.]
MATSKQRLAQKFAVFAVEHKRRQIFWSTMTQPTITWVAIGLTYSILTRDDTAQNAWFAGMFALYGAQIAYAWYLSETTK